MYVYIYIYIYSSFIAMQYHYFLHNYEYKNAFFQFWHEFQNSIPVKIGGGGLAFTNIRAQK